jgi:hypothetical protein
MSKPSIRQKLRSELETRPEDRRLGSGWLSGTLAFLLGTGCLLLVICRAFPGVFITPQLQIIFQNAWFPASLFAAMLAAYGLALLNFVLRPNKVLGFVAVGVTLLAGLIGGLVSVPASQHGVFFGLDFFVLNVIFTGLLFVPLERMFPRYRDQRLFRSEMARRPFLLLRKFHDGAGVNILGHRSGVFHHGAYRLHRVPR